MHTEISKLKDKLVNLNGKNQLIQVSTKGRYYIDLSSIKLPDTIKNWLNNRDYTSIELDSSMFQSDSDMERNYQLTLRIDEILNNIEDITDEIQKEQLNKEYESLIIEQEELQKKITKVTNTAIKKFKTILNRSTEIRKQTGKYTLYVGYSFISCVLKTGLVMNAPLILYPVTIDFNYDGVVISHDTDKEILFNRTALLAINNYLGFKVSQANLSGQNLSDFCNNCDTLEGVITGVIGAKFPNSFEIKHIKPIEKASRERVIYHGLMFGIFDISNSIYSDYEKMEELDESNALISKLFNNDEVVYDIVNRSKSTEYIEPKWKSEDLHLVSKLDQSQEYAVFMANKSSNLVIYGPPGTGKSQVILNIITDQLYRGKKILMVSQKLTALSVVYNRLGELQNNAILIPDSSGRQSFIQHIQDVIDNSEPFDNIDNIKSKISELDEEIDRYIGRLDKIHNDLSCPIEETGISLSYMYKNSKLSSEIEDIAIRLRSKYADIFNYKLQSLYDSFRYNINDYIIESYKTYREFIQIPELMSLSRLNLKLIKQTIPELDRIRSEIKEISTQMDKDMLDGIESEGYKEINAYIDSLIAVKTLLENSIYEIGISNQELPNAEVVMLNKFESSLDKYRINSVYNNIANFRFRLNETANKYNVNLGRFASIDELESFIKRLIIDKFDGIESNARDKIKLYEANNISTQEEVELGRNDFYTLINSIVEFEPINKSFFEKLFKLEKEENINNLVKLKSIIISLDKYKQSELDELTECINKVREIYRLLEKGIADIKIDIDNSISKANTYLNIQLMNNRKVTGLREDKNRLIRNIKELGLDISHIENSEIITKSINIIIDNYDAIKIIESLDDCTKLLLLITVTEGYGIKDIIDAYILYNIDLLETCGIGVNISNEYNELVNKINKLEESRDNYYKELLQLTVSNRLQSADKISLSEMTKDLAKIRKAKSIRQIMHEYTNLMYDLFPIWMMSPETVSEVLPFEKERFDVVIFDEASQLYLEASIPSLYRSKKAIIAGDEKQLKPTSFFITRQSDDEDETEDEIVGESLLDQAKVNFNSVNLLFHYRSKYAELIQFSNYAFYRSMLKIAPNTLTNNSALKPIEYINIHGIYKDNKNEKEADFIINLIKDIITDKNYQDNKKSIGVITFNIKQKECILDKLDEFLVSTDDYTRSCFSEIQNREVNNEDESLFIKNLEDVQGDERDIIIFSIGFGYGEDNKLRFRFGPLGLSGGENRLNVAVSRAKEKEYIVASIEPNELNVIKSKNDGPKLLKQFLEYAKAVSDKNYEMIENMTKPSGYDNIFKKFDSPFEEDVYNHLIELGWRVDTQVGVLGYRIDLAVYDEYTGNYIAGIECDGAFYHSSKYAKERDISRQRFLEGKGWKILRIWSRNWWHNSTAEIKRIDAILRSFKEGSTNTFDNYTKFKEQTIL